MMELIKFDDHFAHFAKMNPGALIQIKLMDGELILVKIMEYGINYLTVKTKDRGIINIQSSSVAYWRDVTNDPGFTFERDGQQAKANKGVN